MKSPSFSHPNHSSGSRPPAAAADADADGGIATLPRINSNVIFSVPSLNTVGDELFTASQFDPDSPPSTDIPLEPAAAAVVPLSVPEANVLQNFVQGTKQQFIDLAGGSLMWRLFVGSGVAIFIGALTLILLGPNPEQLKSDETVHAVSKLSPVDQGPVTSTGHSEPSAAKSAVQLTVSTSENGDRAEPAEFDDPFTEANQIPAKVTRAMHFAEQSNDFEKTAIQPVSHQGTGDQPAWLSGTIDFEED